MKFSLRLIHSFIFSLFLISSATAEVPAIKHENIVVQYFDALQQKNLPLANKLEAEHKDFLWRAMRTQRAENDVLEFLKFPLWGLLFGSASGLGLGFSTFLLNPAFLNNPLQSLCACMCGNAIAKGIHGFIVGFIIGWISRGPSSPLCKLEPSDFSKTAMITALGSALCPFIPFVDTLASLGFFIYPIVDAWNKVKNISAQKVALVTTLKDLVDNKNPKKDAETQIALEQFLAIIK